MRATIRNTGTSALAELLVFDIVKLHHSIKCRLITTAVNIQSGDK